ncbi:tRNA A-37 threonylcarbamoyl transferase component Bud32 [Microbacterium sp. W4I4]|uniref:serine/threonine-protein kinase n=1 Tax=Microbacterium sp. W4I4 TaxID=3042295 RepID=UPI0027800E9F|nr:serine/threonine-protein kinase [Microbacterium sp. W4I4]MDQ0615794.1 tRNA A-37 threonylcarbamoyl transferase component Bud32 [Microbacterium sp. W4I4]
MTGVVEVSTIDDQPTAALLDGRYRLEECVGRGGTAIVYRAEDTALGRTVAIKLLRSHAETPLVAERAYSESAVLASVNHPSLVTLYDARLDPAHPRYLAMEYVDGPTLTSRLTHGPLPSTEAARLARDIAEALQTVHEAGIVHRDVKPSNILLSRSARRDGDWVAKLTDFGIALGRDDARLTAPGIAVGTAAYMAPEQVCSGDLTPAVDVYSLGLVLIEATSGAPAFPVSGAVQTALRHLSGPPEIPDSLDAEWRELLASMTRTEPEARASARDVAEAAAALAEHRVPSGTRATTAPPTAGMSEARGEDLSAPTREYPMAVAHRPWPGRLRRLGVAAVGALAAAAMALIAVAGLWSTTPNADSPEQAVTPAPSTAAPSPTPDRQEPGTPTTSAVDTRSDDSGAGAVDVRQGSPDKSDNAHKGPGSNAGNPDHPPQKDKDR